jgi:hypothetical protein
MFPLPIHKGLAASSALFCEKIRCKFAAKSYKDKFLFLMRATTAPCPAQITIFNCGGSFQPC